MISQPVTATSKPAGQASWTATFAVSSLWSGALFAAALGVAATVARTGPLAALGGIIRVDALGALMLVLITMVGFAATLYSGSYLGRDIAHSHLTPPQAIHFQAWFQPFLVTMVLAALVDNLGFLWVAIEATTLVSAVLVGFYNRRTSLEAAWKYIIICSVGIAVALLGLILIYSAAVRAGIAPAEALSWSALVAQAGRLDPATVRLAYALIVVGFGTKAGLAPMHTWLPDAHSQAPSPVSAVLSGVLLNTALYGILRFHAIAVGAAGPLFPRNLLLVFGMLSLGTAAIFILVQRDLKRLLAYSSVEHMGLVCIGAGLGAPVALFGAVLHMLGHSLVKPLLFFTAGNLGQRYHTYRIRRIRGAARALPVTGALLVAGMLLITGAPPSPLFLSEFSIIAGALQSGAVWVAVLTMLGIALAFAGILLHLREMAFGEPPAHVRVGEPASPGLLPLVVPLATAIILGFWLPPILKTLLGQAAGLLMGGLGS